MQQSHLQGVLSNQATEALDTPIVPVQRAPFALTRPEIPLFTRWIQAKRAYLKAITVEGFRGIGPKITLTLQPGPGLTVVTGRNGSGKSSFAEAAELALTGENKRWSDRTAVWKEGWRNLHAPDTGAI